MWVVLVCLLLAGCGSVLLGEEQQSPSGDGDGDGQSDAGDMNDDSSVQGGSSGMPADATRPGVLVHIQPVDCGACFDLRAEGSGGQPPYAFEWQDGSLGAQRRVCVDAIAAQLSVTALDAVAARSVPHVVRLERAVDAGCAVPDAPDAPDAAVVAPLCLVNASLEGTPAINFGQGAFDAVPWSTCTNPAVTTNMPTVGNETLAVTANVPLPTDGLTYIALGEGQQISQPLCSELTGLAPRYLKIDLAGVDLSDGTTPQTEKPFLEIWGGLAVDCTLRELLWASDGLEIGWQSFCVTLQPHSFITQLTLLANADMTSLSPAYLLVDNLQPVDSCP